VDKYKCQTDKTRGGNDMLLVTGDTHANQDRWFKEIDPYLKDGDTLIVAGDFGYGFWSDSHFSEEMFFDYIANQKYTVLFVDGNHEHFDKLNSLNVERWNGGRVHRIRHNLIHLMRGEIYEIDGVSVFTMGGGYSLDKSIRVEGESWFPNEMPSIAEYANATLHIFNHGKKIDYIVTHTCPLESVTYLSTIKSLGIRDDVEEERDLTGYLEAISNTVDYGKWYFGHFHVDREIWHNQIAVLNTIRNMKTGEIIHGWNGADDK